MHTTTPKFIKFISTLPEDMQKILMLGWDYTGRPQVENPFAVVLSALAKRNFDNGKCTDGFISDVEKLLCQGDKPDPISTALGMKLFARAIFSVYLSGMQGGIDELMGRVSK